MQKSLVETLQIESQTDWQFFQDYMDADRVVLRSLVFPFKLKWVCLGHWFVASRWGLLRNLQKVVFKVKNVR